jgi:hypothetical protein
MILSWTADLIFTSVYHPNRGEVDFHNIFIYFFTTHLPQQIINSKLSVCDNK